MKLSEREHFFLIGVAVIKHTTERFEVVICSLLKTQFEGEAITILLSLNHATSRRPVW